MAYTKYLLQALMASGLALAASKCDGSDKPITIQSQGDADDLGSCSTIKGDIHFHEDAAGDFTFSSIQKIEGSLIARGAANITSISAPQLSSIGDTFELQGLLRLTSLNFDELSSVGSIKFAALPELQGLQFTKGVTDAGSVSITNTGLVNLNGIELKTVGDFDITANKALQEINVNNLKNSTGLFNIAANSPKLKVDLPNLAEGKNMTFRNTSDVQIPSLKSLSGQLAFIAVDQETIRAPNLTECGDLSLDNNRNLKNISFPRLTTINGGLSITHNNELTDIRGFPNLEKVTGAVDAVGKFEQVEFPALEQVSGGFNVQSNNDFDCSQFDDLRDNDAIQGTYECKANERNPTSMDGSSTSGDDSESEDAAVSNLVPPTGLTALVCGLLALLM
ncbi:hypothetical protein VTN31DRAFT_863 [Thermomyces dupontii]|uniref:uncharacterized protein n=1 Tax=Talaromyces thermophilus TaxID=28565 RepID=UPI003743697A